MSEKQAVVFDVDEVLVKSRNELIVSSYNSYLHKDKNAEEISALPEAALVRRLEDLSDDFRQRYPLYAKFNNKQGHRFASFYMMDNHLPPAQSVEDLDYILAHQFPGREEGLKSKSLAMKTKLEAEKTWYFSLVKPYDGMQQLVTDLAERYDMWVCTGNPKSIKSIEKFFPIIPANRRKSTTQGDKSPQLLEILKEGGYAPDSLHYIDDSFSHVIKAVSSAGLQAIKGYVNTWGEAFTPNELNAALEPHKQRIKLVDLAEFRKILLS